MKAEWEWGRFQNGTVAGAGFSPRAVRRGLWSGFNANGDAGAGVTAAAIVHLRRNAVGPRRRALGAPANGGSGAIHFSAGGGPRISQRVVVGIGAIAVDRHDLAGV